MAEAAVIKFSLQEIAELLVKNQGLKEGKWILGFNIAVNLGNFGTSQSLEDLNPGAMFMISSLTLSAVPTPAPPGPEPSYVIDAAKLNS